jgi:hypothetical protein
MANPKPGEQNMKNKDERKWLKKELKSLFKSMDYIYDNYLSNTDKDEQEHGAFATIYQQLGIAWEYLELQCKHWDGYKLTKDKREVCKICGKIKGVDEAHIILPARGHKKIGKKLVPTSKKIFKSKKGAMILADSIDFHGAKLKVDVYNSYKARTRGDRKDINLAAERAVELRENGVKCSVSPQKVHIQIAPDKDKENKTDSSSFIFELRKKDLKQFPVILHFDDNNKLSGLTILK